MDKLTQHHEEKPYNLCLNCAHIGKRCDGPNFLAMDISRLAEWCRLRKDYLYNLDYKWTNAYIAEEAGLSKVSVDRFLAGKVVDLKVSTIAAILKVLVDGTWGQYPCAMGSIEKETIYVDNPELVAECQKLRSDINTAHQEEQQKVSYLLKQIEFKENQMKQKDEQLIAKDKLLDERADYLRIKDDYLRLKDKAIKLLVIALIICVSLTVIALIIDKINPEIGFFWLDETLSAAFNGNNTGMTDFKYTAGWRL